MPRVWGPRPRLQPCISARHAVSNVRFGQCDACIASFCGYMRIGTCVYMEAPFARITLISVSVPSSDRAVAFTHSDSSYSITCARA
eukprot:6663191-Pyramimonas_sp.AAC.1